MEPIGSSAVLIEANEQFKVYYDDGETKTLTVTINH